MSQAKRKYDAILDRTLDTRSIDIERVSCRLRAYLDEQNVSHSNLITDLICEFLAQERYPDPKVLQCDLGDYGFLSTSQVKKLMTELWNDLLEQQEEHERFTKYQKTSSSNGRLGTSHDSNPQHLSSSSSSSAPSSRSSRSSTSSSSSSSHHISTSSSSHHISTSSSSHHISTSSSSHHHSNYRHSSHIYYFNQHAN